ncbi:hypothetical protein ACFL5O_06780 [Myxococcota bacterium]
MGSRRQPRSDLIALWLGTAALSTACSTRCPAGSEHATHCNAEWYYDNPTSPTKVGLCPITCATVRADQAAKLSLELGCPTQYTGLSYSDEYAAVCPRGQRPQWGYLTYDSVTPGNSSILFEVAPGANPTAFKQTAVAAGNDSPVPVHLFPVLGDPDAFDPTLHLRMTLRPSGSDVPELDSWNVSFSCSDAE